MSWVKGSNKNAELSAQNFGIWEWRVNSGAYPELCEVDGDLYWAGMDWERECQKYCEELNKSLSHIKVTLPKTTVKPETKKESTVRRWIKCLTGCFR